MEKEEQSIRVKCKATNEVYKNGDFRIISFMPTVTESRLKVDKQYLTFTCKGKNIPYITIGKEYELEVVEIPNSARGNYPPNYNVISCPSLDAIDLKNLSYDEAHEILMDCTSSDTIAKNILEAYPDFIELIMTKGKEAIDTSKIKGVGESYLSAYARELLSKYKYYHILKKYSMYKLDVEDCKELLDRYIDDIGIEKAMNENPYMVLIEILKRGFEYSDKMIIENRKDLIESEERCEALVVSILKRNEMDGSTRLNGKDLWYYAKHDYSVPYLLKLLMKVCKESDCIYFDEKSGDLSVMSTYIGECLVADFVKNKLESSHKLDIDWKKYKNIDGFEMTDTQVGALKNVCEYDVSLLVGYSGSGKTTAVKGLISMLDDNNLTYCLLAPTGTASKRLADTTNRKASTIHRKVLREEEIFTDVIIVDECSMVDLPTFTMLLKAIENPNCKVVLVGDNAQLMPVGIACVFNDIINSNIVPMTMLTEIFRYTSSGALFVATNVRQGKSFLNSDNELVKTNGNVVTVGNNYKFIQTDNIFEVLINEYKKLLNKGIKPKDILMLSPYNVGKEGSYAINSAIQKEVNPLKPNEVILTREIKSRNKNTTISFKLGDRVLNKKNDYSAVPLESWEKVNSDRDKLLNFEDVGITSVFNGQNGAIRSIDEKKVVIQFGEELIVFDKFKLVNLLLAYCISVHSSQGSEADYVINVVSPEHKRMLNRNLEYVADTRSKKMQIDIGDIGTYNDALLIDGNEQRETWLLDLLIASHDNV